MEEEKEILLFIAKNRKVLIEAIDNHVEEISSLIEGADDEVYIKENLLRNKIIRTFLNKIRLKSER